MQQVIGNGRSGLQDGSYETAQFFRPQGLTLADANTLYVADTENHAIRQVDLLAKTVELWRETPAVTAALNCSRAAEPRSPSQLPWDVST
ncbi:MAG: hypothetical protein R3D55_23320 [Chloroflexota bacterium]